MDDLTVVWNGSHKSVYLCIPQVCVKDQDSAPVPRVTRIAIAVAQLLPTCEVDAITTPQLMAISGASYGVVSQALYRLRKEGQLGWVILPAKGSGREPRAYWRKVAEMAHEHFVKRSGWVVVLRAKTGREFISYGPLDHEILGRGFWRTRQEARAALRELQSHGMPGYVSRATVTLQRHL